MIIIKPTIITDALFYSSDVPENDYPEWVTGTPHIAGNKVIVTTGGVHKVYECLNALVGGIAPNLLDENCLDISDWTNDDSGIGLSQVSAGQFRFSTSSVANRARRTRNIGSPPNQFSLEIRTFFSNFADPNVYFRITYSSSTWRFQADFIDDGLFIYKAGGATTEVGVNIVKNYPAVWQTWRFQVTKTVESTATVEVFKKEEGGVFVSQGTFDCDYEVAGTNGNLQITGQATVDYIACVVFIASIRVATGLGAMGTVDLSPVGNSDWYEVSSTNRWKVFDTIVGSQVSQAESMNYVLTPGLIDSIALLNLDATEVNITVTDPTDGVVYNVTTDLIETIQVTDWYTYFFSPIVRAMDVVKTDLSTSALPPYPNAEISITISNSGGTAKCGAIIVGQKFEIGSLQYGVTPGYTDYSTVTTDTFGNITVVPRAYAKKLRGTVNVKNTIIDEVIRQLLLYKQTSLVWVGNEPNATDPYSCLIVYGFCLSFDPVIQYPAYTIMSFEIQGLI